MTGTDKDYMRNQMRAHSVTSRRSSGTDWSYRSSRTQWTADGKERPARIATHEDKLRAYHPLPEELKKDEALVKDHGRMVENKDHWMTGLPLVALGIEMSPGKCTSDRHKSAVNRGNILCMRMDFI